MSKVTDKYERALKRLTDSTRWNYEHYFNMFREFTGLTPEKLYEMKARDLRSGNLLDQGEVESLFLDFKDSMAKEYSSGTLEMMEKAVDFFFKSLNRKLTLELEDHERTRAVSESTRLIKPSQIKIWYDRVGENQLLRDRALMIFLKDSGLRISDAVKLTVEQYKNIKDVENEFGRFKIFLPMENEKTGDFSHVIVGDETIEHLDAYIKAEGRVSGRVFWSYPRNNNQPKPLDRKAGAQIFLRLSNKIRDLINSGALPNENLVDWHKVSCHSLRYFQFNKLNGAGMGENDIHFLQGKAESRYSQRIEDPDVVYEAYMRAYSNLRVLTPRPEVEMDQRIQELTAQLRDERESRLEMVKILREIGNKFGLREELRDKLDMMEKTFTADVVLVRRDEDDREKP